MFGKNIGTNTYISDKLKNQYQFEYLPILKRYNKEEMWRDFHFLVGVRLYSTGSRGSFPLLYGN